MNISFGKDINQYDHFYTLSYASSPVPCLLFLQRTHTILQAVYFTCSISDSVFLPLIRIYPAGCDLSFRYAVQCIRAQNSVQLIVGAPQNLEWINISATDMFSNFLPPFSSNFLPPFLQKIKYIINNYLKRAPSCFLGTIHSCLLYLSRFL